MPAFIKLVSNIEPTFKVLDLSILRRIERQHINLQGLMHPFLLDLFVLLFITVTFKGEGFGKIYWCHILPIFSYLHSDLSEEMSYDVV